MRTEPIRTHIERTGSFRRERSWRGLTTPTVTMLMMSLPLSGWAQLQMSPTSARQGIAGQGAGQGLDFGFILDGGFSSRDLALGNREKGLGLGHNELTAGGNIDDRFAGRATVLLHSHDGSIEVELEEGYFETRALAAGFSVRAGRFLSQVGYLNEQHLHTDDFVDRPLPYRAFLGSHYYDTGLRLNWIAPTPVYLRLGAELLNGGKLGGSAQGGRAIGAFSLGAKLGADLGTEHSWQVGLSYLRNRLDPAAEAADHDHDHDSGEAHNHTHGARFSGRHFWIGDAVWKWAPNGNNRSRQLRLSAEYIRVTKPSDFATNNDFHQGWYASAVYRFAPQWEVGIRQGDLKVREPHGDHFHGGRLRETEAMIAWKRSHYSALRLQYTRQRSLMGFPEAGRAVMLQYVMSLGGHGAHSY